MICGDWYITAEIDGITDSYKLVPITQIESIKASLENMLRQLKKQDANVVGSDVSPISVETSEHPIKDEEQYPFLYDDETTDSEDNSSSFTNFDDSMI